MRTLILGAAVSGAAAAGLAARLGHQVSVYDRSSTSTIPLRDMGYAVHSGAWADHLLTGIGLVVASPGFPEHSDPIQNALGVGIEVISELEFGARHLTAPYVAVTGTNGKTTVTNTITDMLTESGTPAVSAGNIGQRAEWSLSQVGYSPTADASCTVNSKHTSELLLVCSNLAYAGDLG